MNYACFIGQIIAITNKKWKLKNQILSTKYQIKISQTNSKHLSSIIQFTIWTQISLDSIDFEFYKLNDFVLLEGYISLPLENGLDFKDHQVNIDIFKIYPLLNINLV